MIQNINGSAEQFLADLDRMQATTARAERQISSGLKVENPSDAPDQIREILQLRAEIQQHQQIQANLGAIKDQPWNGARFLHYAGIRHVSEHLPSLHIDAIVRDEVGNESSLVKELSGADTVVMVTATEAAAEAAEIIGNACAARGIAATGLVLVPTGGEGTLGRILAAMRPHATMLVVSSGEDYVGEMLAALRA